MKTLQEILIDALRSTSIYEMAKYQSECENIVRRETQNILENLTLILYFNISGLYTRNLEHWKNELITNIANSAKFEVKKDKSKERRLRIIKRVFDEEDMKVYDWCYKKIFFKFDKEKEVQQDNPMYKEWLDQAIISSINLMDDIIDIIANNDPVQIKQWVNKL